MRGVVCPRCRTLHEVGVECPNCRKKWNRDYNTNRKKDVQWFYTSKEWKLKRAEILDYYCGVDVWKLGLEGKIVPCKRPIVHHIYPYTNPAYKHLALSNENLICVSSTSHIEIHELYDTNRFEQALEIIKQGKERYKEIQNGQREDFGRFTES